ncbi:MAG: hypothetical protein ACI89L_001943 [Phycisphaerales bacterium]|jgi:hypothetical protein
MSQYSSEIPPGGVVYEDETKTSIAAILGFVVSLIGCCLPMGLLGVVLGVFGLIGIGRSGGRVGGKGLAIAAIIIGILNTMIWVGVAAGALVVGRQARAVGNDMQTVLVALDAGDYDGARGMFVGSLATADDASLKAFGDTVQAEFGDFGSLPDSLGELISGFFETAPLLQNYQGRNDQIPISAKFENGRVLLLFVTDNTGRHGPGKGSVVPMLDMAVVGMDGTEVRLSDYVTVTPTTLKRPDPAGPDTPAEPDAPTDPDDGP